MIFFTILGISIAALFGYMILFGIGVLIMYVEDDAAYFGALFAGIVISLLLAIFICNPESFGYQKITVSENVVEVNR